MCWSLRTAWTTIRILTQLQLVSHDWWERDGKIKDLLIRFSWWGALNMQKSKWWHYGSGTLTYFLPSGWSLALTRWRPTYSCVWLSVEKKKNLSLTLKFGKVFLILNLTALIYFNCDNNIILTRYTRLIKAGSFMRSIEHSNKLFFALVKLDILA